MISVQSVVPRLVSPFVFIRGNLSAVISVVLCSFPRFVKIFENFVPQFPKKEVKDYFRRVSNKQYLANPRHPCNPWFSVLSPNSWPFSPRDEWSRRDASDIDGLSREAERSGSE